MLLFTWFTSTVCQCYILATVNWRAVFNSYVHMFKLYILKNQMLIVFFFNLNHWTYVLQIESCALWMSMIWNIKVNSKNVWYKSNECPVFANKCQLGSFSAIIY